MKIYKYKGKTYCDKIVSKTDNKCDGNLYNLFMELGLRLDKITAEMYREFQFDKTTDKWKVYYRKEADLNKCYDSIKELIEGEFKDSVTWEVIDNEQDIMIEKLSEFCLKFNDCSECPLDTFAVYQGTFCGETMTDDELQEAYSIAYPQDTEIIKEVKE